MSGFDRLTDLLPTLWRPEPGDRTLVAEWLRAVGQALDQASATAQEVLRAHWADTADAALWAPHHQADRRERGLLPVNVRQPADRAELQRYPYLCDSARIAALLDLAPWRDPASLRENVEEYRLRVQDIVAAYTAGLVTVAALRRLVEAALPEDMAAPLDQRRAGFAIEEPVALRSRLQPLAVPGAQEGGLVAPLSRWRLDDAAGTPTVIVEGVAAAGASTGATTDPLIERYTPGALPVGIGLAWQGTLAAGEALRFTPSRSTWLLRAGALDVSAAEVAANAERDPSANGPWTAGAALAGSARGLIAAADGMLWAIENDAGADRVQRFDGAAYTAVDTDAPAGPFHALLAVGDSVWLAAEQGLFRAPLWPDTGAAAWTAVAGVAGVVRALAATPQGFAAAGTDGLWQLDAAGAITAHAYAGVDLHALAWSGAQGWVATDAALYLVDGDQTFRYDGSGLSETTPDWLPVAAPDNAMTSPLPPVRALARTADGSLWIATADGLARWRVRDAKTTLLEAFPDLFTGPVDALHVDDRGLLWIGAEAGLFRYDGAALAQYDFAAARWARHGAADTVYPSDIATAPRGHWRHDRLSARWQQWTGSRFADPQLPPRAAASDPVQGVATTPSVRAERGSWDGSEFAATAAVPAAELLMRIKPSEDRIVAGGPPMLPPWTSECRWRYLQLDLAPTPPAAGRPWWSREGQLFAPPQRDAPWPGHYRTPAAWHDDGHFDDAVFVYPPSARLTLRYPLRPEVGVRIRLHQPDLEKALEPALIERVWALVERARAAGVPLQLMVEGRVVKGTS